MIAVIGIDGQFAGQHNIDRVERAFYQGIAAPAISNEMSADELCQASVERLATANQLAVSDINVVVVGHTADATVRALTLSALTFSSLAEALTACQSLLKQNKTVALIGVNQLIEPVEQAGKGTLSFDKAFEAYQGVAGVAGLLLAPLSAVKSDAYTYAHISGFDSNSDIATATQAALSQAQLTSEQVTLLEVSALADTALAQAERSGLISAYSNSKQLHTAIGSARSVTGEGDGFSQVAGLLKTVIALHQRYIPPVIGWQQCADADLPQWQSSPFYFPTEARPWFPHSNGDVHAAAYSCQTASDYCHVVLQETQAAGVRKNGFMACSELSLCLLTGDNQADLLAALDKVEQQIDTQSVEAISYRCFEAFKDSLELSDNSLELSDNSLELSDNSPNTAYRLSLVAQSTKELRREVKMAKAGIVKAFAELDNPVKNTEEHRNGEWETPKGSYFSALPVNGENNVSFIYPGIGATYLGLGRDLFHLFPQIYQPVADLADDISETLKDTRLNPRSINRLSVKALTKLDLELRGDLANIAECGVGFACIFTKVFEEVFNVKADYATGYSMGEVSMYAALGCWQQPGLLSARLAQSDTFNHRLCGELKTLKSHWGMEDAASNQLLWETYTVKTTIDQVSVALEGEDRVYCTIVNTPDSLLLGGYPPDCERVIQKMGVWAMPLQMANAIHSEPAQREYDHMVELHTMAVTERIKTKMYSSSCYLPIPQRTKAIAHSVAKCLCDPVDYPRLINTLHDKGARVFVEMGPGRSLCRWVGRILDYDPNDPSGGGQKPFVAVPVNAKGTGDELTYVRALARLVSHGVRLDLDSLFHGSIVVSRHP